MNTPILQKTKPRKLPGKLLSSENSDKKIEPVTARVRSTEVVSCLQESEIHKQPDESHPQRQENATELQSGITEFQVRYLQIRCQVVMSLEARGTEPFWIQWVKDLLPVQPTRESMSEVDRFAEIIGFQSDSVVSELKEIVAAYFALHYSVHWPIGYKGCKWDFEVNSSFN